MRTEPESIWADYIRSSSKAREKYTVGIELEIIGFYKISKKRLSYEDIAPLLRYFCENEGWKPDLTNEGNIIGATKGSASLSLEPGGQFELSTTNNISLDILKAEILAFTDKVRKYSKDKGFVWLTCGHDPVSKIPDIPRMPKKRYQIMEKLLPPRGKGILNMMFCTAGTQSSFDYSSPEDAIKKLRVGNIVGIYISALLANSPFIEGGLTQIPGNRSLAWNTSDVTRTGCLPGILNPDYRISDYAAYVAASPMFHYIRDNVIYGLEMIGWDEYSTKNETDPAKLTRDFLNHSSTVFPYCRLKSLIETRTTDAGNIHHVMSQAAFWKGLLYDQSALDAANERVLQLRPAELEELIREFPEKGLNSKAGSISIRGEAEFFLDLAKKGLMTQTPSESKYLAYQEKLLNDGKSRAEHIIAKYSGHSDTWKILSDEGFEL